MLNANIIDKRAIYTASAILLLGIVGLVWYIINFQNNLVLTSALESAKLYSQALTEFRTIYTDKVVQKVKLHPDFEVSHDYANKKHVIPLPATLSMELGKEIGKHLSGAETWLYSKYPFPWRKNIGGGLRDEFARQAWEFLKKNPNKTYYKFVSNYQGRQVLRFATADLMRQSCIQCHNNHPQTPKNNWKLGEVRGVLEIVHPMETIFLEKKKGTFGLFFFAAGIGFMGIFSLSFLVRGYQKINDILTAEVKIKTQSLLKAKEAAESVSKELKHSYDSLLEAKTKAENYQTQLIESNKMASLGAMSAGIAHELNQPLGAILLKTQLIAKLITRGDYEKINQIAEQVKNQTLRAKKIMDALRVFSREDKEIERDQYDLNLIIDDVLTLFSDEFNLLQVNLKLQLTQHKKPIYVSYIQIGQVLSNLLSNARDAVANSHPKNITITTELIKENLVLKISDNGHGISKNKQKMVFEPFYTNKPIGKGTGLGLSLSYSMVKDNGGEISLSSEEGIGTTFQIVFPTKKRS